MQQDYYAKYLKYKSKYLELKNQMGGKFNYTNLKLYRTYDKESEIYSIFIIINDKHILLYKYKTNRSQTGSISSQGVKQKTQIDYISVEGGLLNDFNDIAKQFAPHYAGCDNETTQNENRCANIDFNFNLNNSLPKVVKDDNGTDIKIKAILTNGRYIFKYSNSNHDNSYHSPIYVCTGPPTKITTKKK